MTYQNIGYWVGQANDASTGNHPTGWTTGQRWSETASEWNTMYNTEYASGRDTSTGQPGKPSGSQHPTGWVTNQLWSVTATQWNTMWGTEWTNARDTSAGQTSSGLGTQHPSGWTSAQFWYTTAEQWNGMWGTEWRAARDPQGYEQSYPGQAANAVYWSSTALYWKDQADYYYGPSGIWSNGTTWITLYNNYVGYYNDMVSQRDTWASRANQAWGRSRTWPSGESWEAEALRVAPAGSGTSPGTFYANLSTGIIYSGSPYQCTGIGYNSIDSSTFTGTGSQVTVLRTGQYAISAAIKSSYTFDLHLRRNGGNVWTSRANCGDGQGWGIVPDHGYQTEVLQLNAGDVITIWYCSLVGNYGPFDSHFQGTFIPTPTWPH